MSGARSRRLPGSLGDSWGDAEYESEGGASIHTASDVDSDAASEMDSEEQEELATNEHRLIHENTFTPQGARITRASSKPPETAPITPAKRVVSRHSPRSNPRSGSQSYQSTPGSESLEPSFIMPSMHGSPSGIYKRSPLGASEIRSRQSRLKSSQHQRSSANSSPRISSHRTPLSMPPSQTSADSGPGPWYYLNIFRQQVVAPVLQYIFGVGGYAMQCLKPIFGVALAVGFIVLFLTSMSGLLQSTVRGALTPVCIIPGSSFVLPFCASVHGGSNQYDEPNFDELMQVQAKLEDVVETSKDVSTLPNAMDQSRLAIKDLKTLVHWSKLPSKSELEVEFDYFIATAKEAARDLIDYNAKIGLTMDRVISTNGWTMQVLQGLAEAEAATGSLSRTIHALNPWSAPTLQQKIYDQYIRHVSKDKEDIGQLIEQALALMSILDHLEGHLDRIADIAARDNFHISQNREELFSSIWTKLGGNAATRKGYDKQLTLLREVFRYRKDALSHVTTTLARLQEIAAGLDNLREGVAAPEILGFRNEIPLSYYVEVIEKAVDRLSDIRGDSRQIERDAYRKVMRTGDERGLPDRPSEIPTVYAKSSIGKKK